MSELVPRLIDLARRARAHRSEFHRRCRGSGSAGTVARRHRRRVQRRLAEGWDGFGLAVQAYQKRAEAVIGYVDDLARALNRRMMVRLVKGAYWDTEIKRAQERGLDDYPVFTRKAMTDLNYMACAQKLLALRPRLFPQFATHNALTVATVLELAGDGDGFEFQRLHGMGEALYASLLRGPPRHRLPDLCAGRQSPRPAGLSGAPPAGKRRQFVLRGGRGRRRGAGCHAAAASGRNHRKPDRAGIRTSACRAIFTAAARQIRAASNSASAPR